MSVSPGVLGPPCLAPARTVRVGAVPRPRLRPLHEVLAAIPPAATHGPARRPEADDTAEKAFEAAARPAALSLFGVLAEILDGHRPASHLKPLCDDDLYAHVLGRLPAGRRSPRSRVRGVRVCTVGPTAAEVSAVLDRGDRARALAARLERPGSRWRLTALEIG